MSKQQPPTLREAVLMLAESGLTEDQAFAVLAAFGDVNFVLRGRRETIKERTTFLRRVVQRLELTRAEVHD